MHKNTDFHIEQTRLNDTYRKLNSGNDFSSYINEQEVNIESDYRNYLETGEPVGSRTIAKHPELNLSSATIRMRWQIWKIWDLSYSLTHPQEEFLPMQDIVFM